MSLPVNAHFKHILQSGKAHLRIGIDHRPKRPGQLVSFGRDPSSCDVVLPQEFPERQCHFFIHSRTGELVLRDDTANDSTLLFIPSTPSDPTLTLPDCHPRQRVVLASEQAPNIKMGDALFTLLWGERERAFQAAKNTPIITRSPPQGLTPALGLERGKIVHKCVGELGKGATATVFKTLNLHTGDYLAVKIFSFDSWIYEDIAKKEVRKEVGVLSQLSHVRFKRL